jgi:predicted dehydrogenase
MIKVGLIGLGNMGQNHLRVLSMLKGVEVIFVADSNLDLATRIGSDNGIKGVVDPRPLLPSVDAVVICTPTVTHTQYIRLVSEYVKNIFVEKPLAETYDECEKISSFAKEKKLNIQVGFIERFNPAIKCLRTIFGRSKQLISIDLVRASRVSARITDVDVITDLMVHDIDLAILLLGPAKTVSAHGYGERNMIDFASAVITHESGQFSRIQASRITDKKIRQIQATCIDMFVECNLLSKEIVINRQSELHGGGQLPYTITATQEKIFVPPEEALLAQLRTFMDLCHNQNQSLAPGILESTNVMRICSQIQYQISKCNKQFEVIN